MRPPWARTPLRLLLSHFPASAHQPHPCPRSLPVPVHRTASVLWAGPSVLCVRLALRPCEPQCARPHGGAQIPAPTPVGPRDSGRLASACRRCRPVPTVFFLAPAWAPSRGAAAGGGFVPAWGSREPRVWAARGESEHQRSRRSRSGLARILERGLLTDRLCNHIPPEETHLPLGEGARASQTPRGPAGRINSSLFHSWALALAKCSAHRRPPARRGRPDAGAAESQVASTIPQRQRTLQKGRFPPTPWPLARDQGSVVDRWAGSLAPVRVCPSAQPAPRGPGFRPATRCFLPQQAIVYPPSPLQTHSRAGNATCGEDFRVGPVPGCGACTARKWGRGSRLERSLLVGDQGPGTRDGSLPRGLPRTAHRASSRSLCCFRSPLHSGRRPEIKVGTPSGPPTSPEPGSPRHPHL